MNTTLSRKNIPILGVPIGAVDTSLALQWVHEDLMDHRKGYVCFVSVHGLMEARRSPRFATAYSGAALRLPDGAPVAWVGRLQGEDAMRRVAGPEFMLEIFGDPRFENATHYLYGGEEGVAPLLRERLLERFPHAKIVGLFTPPFRELTSEEEQGFVEEIECLKPDMIWVGIGCPKQEQFMSQYLDRLNTKIMFGVGAAFDFHTGRIQDSPIWVKRAGLQWFHRLIQDPRRLWKRYLVSNTTFLWVLLLHMVGISAQTSTTERATVPQPPAIR